MATHAGSGEIRLGTMISAIDASPLSGRTVRDLEAGGALDTGERERSARPDAEQGRHSLVQDELGSADAGSSQPLGGGSPPKPVGTVSKAVTRAAGTTSLPVSVAATTGISA